MPQQDSEFPDLPRGIAMAWGVAANPQRGPKREMSVERIVEAAVELADAEGLGAVSMSAVAKKLGFTPMSLYRYVTAKDDLLLLMQEEGVGLPPEDFREHEGWRAQLGALFDAQVRVFLRHPWMLSIPITGVPAMPNNLAWMEAGLEALAETPLNDDERISITLLLAGQARWYGTVVAGYDEQARTGGLTQDEVTRHEAGLFDALVTAEEFPHLRQAVESGVFLSDSDPFRFGFDRVLDGVTAYIDGLERGEPHRPVHGWTELDDADVAEDKKYREAAKATRAAQKAVRLAEKELRQARKAQAQAMREARERIKRRSA